MRDIKEIRKDIDKVDNQMKDLFCSRLDLAKEVAEYKFANNLPIFNQEREKEVIAKNTSSLNEPYKSYYEKYIVSLMGISKEYQSELLGKDIVSYCGVEGAFAHIATCQLFPNQGKKNYTSFEEVFKSVLNKESTKGVIPFENSFTGEVGEVLDLLLEYPLYINEIYSIDVKQNLLGIPGSKIEDIKIIYTHPQAFSQCSTYLRDRDIEFIPSSNTALSAKIVKEKNDKSIACIASLETAKANDLVVLAEGIQSSKVNQTRFIVIGNELPTTGNRFNAIFTVDSGSGKLSPILDIIAKNNFNLESIRSRSIKSLPWEYYFYIEVEGSLSDPRAQEMISQLKEKCNTFKIIGSYTK